MTKKKSNKIFFVLITLAIILILGIFLYFILQNRDNYQKISNNNRFLELLKKDGNVNATFTKVKYDLNMDFDYFGPMELYEKDGKKYFGTKKWYYTFDDKKDQIIYNYDNSKSTFMKKININYFNKTFCKDRCNLEVYLFATDGHPEMPRNKVHTFFVKNPNSISEFVSVFGSQSILLSIQSINPTNFRLLSSLYFSNSNLTSYLAFLLILFFNLSTDLFKFSIDSHL